MEVTCAKAWAPLIIPDVCGCIHFTLRTTRSRHWIDLTNKVALDKIIFATIYSGVLVGIGIKKTEILVGTLLSL